jgi:hyperosmotically inducible protein
MRNIFIAVVACAALAVSAVAQDPALPNSRTRLGGTDSQQRISREVLHNLLMNPWYSVFDDLEYQVNGDTVKLMGAVTEPAVKNDAIASVKKIEGVNRVDDQIKVLPPSSMDDGIRRAEYRAIFGFDGLSRYSWGAVPPIHIIVDSGHVTLTGFVDNESDRNMAEIQAKSVPGVFSVDNRIQVAENKRTKK